MATTLDTIAIEFGAQWTGGGIIQRIITDLNRVARATKEVYDPIKNTSQIPAINAMGSAFTHAGAAVLKYQASLRDTESRMRSLGEVMAGVAKESNPFFKGNLGSNQEAAIATYGILANRANELREQIAATSKAADGGGSAVAGWTKNLALAAGAAGAALLVLNKLADAFKQIKDLSEEGAGIRQTAKSFEFLADSIYQTPALLEEMRRASRGTISDLQLMSSYMTLVAGTTPEFGAALTSAIPKLLEIAKAANVLNPTLGDTTFFFESLARGIKRSEIRILDNLGLVVKVGQANKTYAASIGTTVEALTAEQKQMALLNETLRVGGLLINQIGGDMTSLLDPYQQWDANTQNLTNSLKEFVSISFQPLMTEMAETSGVWAEFVRNVVAGMKEIEAAGSSGDGGGIGGFLGNISRNILGESTGFIPIFGPALAGLEQITNGMRDYNAVVAGMGRGLTFFEALNEAQQNLVDGAGVVSRSFEKITDRNNFNNPITKETADTQRNVERMKQFYAEMRREAVNYLDFQQQRYVEGNVNRRRAIEESRHAAYAYVDSIMPSDAEALAIARWRSFRQVRDRINQESADAISAMQQRWRDLAAETSAAQAAGWSAMFAGGEFNNDWIIGDIRRVGEAWVTTSSATAEQRDKLAELNKELSSAREKLGDLNNGIGVQGDEADSTNRKISDLTAEIANYERVIGELNAGITTTTSKRNIPININDVAVFNSLVDALGDVGASADQLGTVAVGLGLIGEEAADAMLKVSLLDGIVKNLGVMLKAGDIDASEIPEAIKGVIAELESKKTYAQIVADVKVSVNEARAKVNRELILPEEDRTREISVGANLDPANRALAEGLGLVEGSASSFAVDADTSKALATVQNTVDQINGMTATLDIQGVYHPPANQPGGGTPGGGPRPVPFALGGYVRGSKGRPVAAVVHAGEYVMRPEAVERLGVGFLDALNRGVGSSNRVSVQNNFYAPVGGGEDTRTVIVKASNDAADELSNVLRRSGYRI